MKITEISVKRPVGTILIVLSVIVLGFFAIPNIPVSFWPEFVAPSLIITVPYPGVGPAEIEEQIAKPLEETLSTIDGTEKIETTCMEGVCQITVGFGYGVDFEETKLSVQERTNRARSRFPRGALEPVVLQVQDFLPPGIELGFFSETRGLNEVRDFIETKLKNRFLRLENVATVRNFGGYERHIAVKINPDKLYAYGITMTQVNGVLVSENMDVPAGKLETEHKNYFLRTSGKFEEIEDIENIIVATAAGTPVYLKNVAEVSLENKEREVITRLNGREIVGLTIREKGGGNTVAMCDEVKRELERIKRTLPGDITVQIIQDQSVFIKTSIRNVLRNAGIGAVLAGIIILLFLGSLRNTLIIALSIPISIIATFVLVDRFGLTINTISLGGLALGVGMIVDSSVVVLENIFRHLKDKGSGDRLATVVSATGEVGQAITASTLTSIVVFLPLAFLVGLFAVLLGELALTIVFALSIAIVVSLTVVPMLSFKLMRTEIKSSGVGAIAGGWQKFFNKILDLYGPVLRFSLRHRLLTVFFAFALLGASFIILVPRLDTELLPSINEGEFVVELLLPESTRLDVTNDMTLKVEEELLKRKEVDKVYTVVGVFSARGELKPNFATMTVNLKKKYYPVIESVMQDIRRRWRNFPGTRVMVRQVNVTEGMMEEPVNVRIAGDNFEILSEIGNRAYSIVKDIPGVINLKSSVQEGLSEFVIQIDRLKASELGLTGSQIAGSVRLAVLGASATNFSSYGEEYEITVQAEQSRLKTVNHLLDFPLKTVKGTTVPLRSVAQVVLDKGPSEIKRFDQQRVVEVKGDIADRSQREVIAEVQSRINDLQLPPDYYITYGGESRAIADSFQSLVYALIIAVFLVYVVMGTQFNSFLHPFTIALTIPFALIGVLLGLFVFGANISMNALLGVIMLAGIVVNNGILLIDYINQLRAGGAEKTEAIISGGLRRLRPILITSLTTIFGMLPIALGFGEGGEALQPLGAVVIGGLLTSTFLTLIVIPCVYSLLGGLSLKKKRG